MQRGDGLVFHEQQRPQCLPRVRVRASSREFARVGCLRVSQPPRTVRRRGLLYAHIKRKVTHRSLLLLYTNFEHISALKRQLPFFTAIAKKHVLVVVFFENTELESLITADAEDLQTIYHKTIAEKFSLEKKLMQKELQKHGIQTIL